MSRKGALETCGQPADKQASKESGEPHLTSSDGEKGGVQCWISAEG